MTDVPPEIEKLREQAWEDGALPRRLVVDLSEAVAAVLVCEQRMKHDLLDRDLEATALRAERDSERQRTVAEIVKALRDHDSSEPLGSAWVHEWAAHSIADRIESRFGAKEEEDDA